MPLTGCTIQTIFPSDNPNEGRVKINQNFQCLSNNISGSGSTSNSGNRWYIPSGETVNIASTYQGFLYGDLIIDGTINLEIDSQLVVINGDIIATGGTIIGAGTIYALDLPTFDTYVTGGTYSNGTAIFTDNTGDTFEVTGFTSFDTYVTGGTYSAGTITFSNNAGGTFDVTGLSTGSTLFFNAYEDFPLSGTNNAIYVDDTNNIGYLWNSSANTYTNIAGTDDPIPPDPIPLTFAQAATTGALSFSPIYTNGLSGVGATLSATTVGVLRDTSGVGKIDFSYNPSVGDVILVKNQASQLQNGLYTIDDTGSISTRYILTRASDFDESSELYPLQINILGGNENNLKFFNQITPNPIIGTSGLVFSVSSQQSITYQTAFVDTTTSAPLPSCTYISGTTFSSIPGIGAVLSATSVGALGFINGLSASTSSSSVNGFLRVLVKDQVNPAHNGDYSVTNAGSPTTKWVLTRINAWAGAYSRYTRYFIVSNNGSTKAGKYYFTTPNNPVLSNANFGVAPINIVEYGGAGGGTTFTGGTVVGETTFTAGLTATSISATTYLGLPTDVRVTGGTYSSGVATFTNNTGGTFSVTGFSSSLLWFAEPSYAPPTYPLVSSNDSIAVGNNSQALSDYMFSVGTNAGQQATGSTYSNFLGFQAGKEATDSYYSNFLGNSAGYQAPNAYNSNFLGYNAGYQAINSIYSNFLGTQAGYQATGSSYSNFLGNSAGYQSTDVSQSNFLGLQAGYQAINSSYSNFLGSNSGYQATGSNYSNFIGLSAGYQATGSSFSNFVGYRSGYLAVDSSYSNFLGSDAGYQATNVSDSNFLGASAGQQATGSSQSNFLGNQAGYQATGATYSNFFGQVAGYQATDSTNSNFFGYQSGYQAAGANGSNFLGFSSGSQATGSTYSNFLGFYAGYQAIGASQSNFLGNAAGFQATGSSRSNFLGTNAGYQATGSSYSNFFGYNAGRSFAGNSLGSNNIIIGTHISLSGGTSNAMNIGGVLFGSNLYSSIAGNPSISPTASGRIGIGVVSPLSTFHVNGQSIFSGSGVGVVTVIGSGNTSPLFSVQGSYGELFSITDSLSGSLFSVNDISGLPILEVFDDNTTLMGSFLAPSLNTTVKIAAGIGDTNIYSLIASAYTGAFFEYTASSSEGIRAGSIMSVWSGTSIAYTETPTSSIGTTTGITFNMTIGTTATLRASGTTAGWTVKTIVRSI